MFEKNCIQIGDHIIEQTDFTMSYQEFVDHIEDIVMKDMVESISGALLLRLFRLFDTEVNPLTAIEFCDFWDRLDNFEQFEWLLFADELVLAKEN